MDKTEMLINAAYALFPGHSIFEVIDLDRSTAVERMKELYGPRVDPWKMEWYLDLIYQVKGWRREQATATAELSAAFAYYDV